MNHDTIEQIRTMTQLGLHKSEIARRLGMSRQNVGEYCRRHKISASNYGKMIDVDPNWIINALAEGKTQKSIAEELGMTPGAICHYLKRQGIKAK